MRLTISLPCALLLGIAATPALTSTAQAQFMAGGPPGAGNIATGQRQQANTPSKPALAEPSAVPGARARSPIAPATRSAAEMAPTDALFDAINRGDIAAARDAVSRGADLGGVNVLGMNPLELSVDLGRNDISFMLLSMRGEDSGRGARAVSNSDASSAKASAAPLREATAPSSHRAAAAHAARPARVAVVKPAGPKLFANDGGTPQPNAGFLGFGGGRSASD
jgi:hypothetical protein